MLVAMMHAALSTQCQTSCYMSGFASDNILFQYHFSNMTSCPNFCLICSCGIIALLIIRPCGCNSCRSKEGGDSIVAVHPGLLQTELARQWLHNGCPSLLRPACSPVIDFLFYKTFLPPEYAVQTILHAATAPAKQVSICCICGLSDS